MAIPTVFFLLQELLLVKCVQPICDLDQYLRSTGDNFVLNELIKVQNVGELVPRALTSFRLIDRSCLWDFREICIH